MRGGCSLHKFAFYTWGLQLTKPSMGCRIGLYAPVAQRTEQWSSKPKAVGSNPSGRASSLDGEMDNMSRVTYHEFRPGHWVKLVDGKIVGRATAEEVAAWKREKAEQITIWQDVVQRVASAEPKLEVSPEVPLPELKKISTEPVTIWQDVLSELSRATPHVESLHEEAGAIDKAKQLPQETSEAAKPKEVSPPLVRKARRKEPEKAVPSRRAVKVESIPTAQTVSDKTATTKEIAKSKPKAEGEVASDSNVMPVRAPEVEERGTTKALSATRAASEQVASQPVSKAKATRTSKAVAQKKGATSEDSKFAPRVSAPQRAAPVEPATEQQPSAKMASRQTRPSPAASKEKASQLYLWIMAGAADDLVATVRSGLARYQERFQQPAEVVLCHMDDMAILEKANLPVDVRQGKGVPPRNFWIGLK